MATFQQQQQPVAGTVVPPQYQQQHQQPMSNGYGYQQQPQHYQTPTAQWATSLCDCFVDIPSCLEGWCCSPCQQSRQYSMIEHQKPEIYWPVCLGIYCVDAFTGCGTPGMAFYLRMQLRKRYGLAGDDCQDGCYAFCCTPCAVCQHHREMATRSEWPQGCCLSKAFEAPRAMGAMGQQQQQPEPYGGVQPGQPQPQYTQPVKQL